MVLNLLAVLVPVNLHDLDVLCRDVVPRQHLLGQHAVGAAALGDHEHRLAGDLLINGLFHCHADVFFLLSEEVNQNYTIVKRHTHGTPPATK